MSSSCSSSTPVIAIVGRPNVGKSTLFNCLTQTRDALVADTPGVTRDRQYGIGKVGSRPYIIIDTGGIGETETDIDNLTKGQAWLAIEESDLIIFMVDARAGLTPVDLNLAEHFRRLSKPVCIVANKIDGLDETVALSEFHALGLTDGPIGISASNNRNTKPMIGILLNKYCKLDEEEKAALEKTKEELLEEGIKVAIVGRPNVGKSTLVNRIYGDERVVVFDAPGTTRDTIYVPIERHGKKYTLIDTAGVRRRSRREDVVEKFSVIKTLQAIQDANVVLLLIDGQEGVTDQDLSLLTFTIDAGRALVIAINKWDNLTIEQREIIKEQIRRKLAFTSFATVHLISALHGTGVGNLFGSVDKAYDSAMRDLPTPLLNKILEEAITAHAPPRSDGRRIKLRYAHCGGHNPPIIVIHGTQTENLTVAYKRYLIGAFLKALKLEGTPVRIETKTSENPYSNKNERNLTTPSQRHEMRRELRFKKKKAAQAGKPK